MRKNIYLVLPIVFFLLLSACSVFDPPEKTPSYIRINKISLTTIPITEGPNTSAIVDAWVYVDDKLIGVFELPATIPVLSDGNHKVTIRGGIKLGGMAGYRAYYPFYEPYEVSTDLVPGEIVEITPQLKYTSSATFPLLENFESAGVLFSSGSLSDTSIVVVPSTDSLINEKKYGAVYLDDTHPNFEVYNSSNYNLPTTGEPVFVEIDYSTSIDFTLGILIDYTSSVVSKDLVTILYRDSGWKKMYINLTTTLTEATTASGFKLYIRAVKPTAQSNAIMYFDNIKIVH
ncbi:MAG: hypothetical protein V2A54_06835 [Bacteroidota bacterium]